MKELIKPNQNEISYEENKVKALCGELRECWVWGCRRTQSADLEEDEILF